MICLCSFANIGLGTHLRLRYMCVFMPRQMGVDAVSEVADVVAMMRFD